MVMDEDIIPWTVDLTSIPNVTHQSIEDRDAALGTVGAVSTVPVFLAT